MERKLVRTERKLVRMERKLVRMERKLVRMERTNVRAERTNVRMEWTNVRMKAKFRVFRLRLLRFVQIRDNLPQTVAFYTNELPCVFHQRELAERKLGLVRQKLVLAFGSAFLDRDEQTRVCLTPFYGDRDFGNGANIPNISGCNE